MAPSNSDVELLTFGPASSEASDPPTRLTSRWWLAGTGVVVASLCIALVAVLGGGEDGRADSARFGTAPSAAPAASDGARLSFLTKVNAVCSKALSDHAGSPFPARDLNLRDLKSVEPTTVASYNRRYRGQQLLRRGFVAVGEPLLGRRRWNSLRSAFEQEAATVVHQMQLLRDGNAVGFAKTLDPSDSLEHQLKSTAQEFGLIASSPCGRFYR
jgi:hypothetical protein